MPLTHAEKNAGRWWRAQQEQALEERAQAVPGVLRLPVHVVHARHECPALDGKNLSFEHAEVYARNPRIGVCYCSVIKEVPDELLGSFPHEDCAGGAVLRAGTIAFVYRDGQCKHCGLHAISHSGFIVECASRPPLGRERRVGAGN